MIPEDLHVEQVEDLDDLLALEWLVDQGEEPHGGQKSVRAQS